VRGDQDVDAGDAHASQVGRRSAIVVAAVDERRRAVRHLDEDAVGLPHVDEVHRQVLGIRPGLRDASGKGKSQSGKEETCEASYPHFRNSSPERDWCQRRRFIIIYGEVVRIYLLMPGVFERCYSFAW
jgi:hypothetical protein